MSVPQTAYELTRMVRRLVKCARAATPDPKSDKRVHQRFSYVLRGRGIYLRSVKGGGQGRRRFWVYAKDISRSGISFIRRFQMFPGEVIQLTFPGNNGRTIEMPVRVVRCRQVDFPFFEIGTRFCCMDELES